MSGQVTVLVELAIADGKADEFAEISQREREIAKSKEPGTLSFSQFFNDDRSVAVSLERYADSDALVAHMKNARENVSHVEEIAKIVRVEVFGDVSDEVKATFKAFDAQIFQPFLDLAT